MTRSPVRPTDRGLRRRNGGTAVQTLCALVGGHAPPVPEWPSVIVLALEHDLGPLLYRRLLDLPEDLRSPNAYLRPLRESYALATSRNLHLLRQGAEAVAALQAVRIPVMALKGLHLAAAVYPACALRPMGDIDLLVPPARLDAAGEVLRGLGYLQSRAGHAAFASHHHAPPFTRPGGVPIELHHGLVSGDSPFGPDPHSLWARARPVPLGGALVLGLGMEDLLVHLCIHTVYNHACMVPLRSIYDIAAVVEKFATSLDWDHVMDVAGRSGASTAVFCGLSLAHRLFLLDVPPEALRGLRPARPEALVEYAHACLLRTPCSGVGEGVVASLVSLLCHAARRAVRRSAGKVGGPRGSRHLLPRTISLLRDLCAAPPAKAAERVRLAARREFMQALVAPPRLRPGGRVA